MEVLRIVGTKEELEDIERNLAKRYRVHGQRLWVEYREFKEIKEGLFEAIYRAVDCI